MKKLINRSYEAIKARGLITPSTKEIEFINKVKQAVIEECKKYDVKNYTNIFVIMGIN